MAARQQRTLKRDAWWALLFKPMATKGMRLVTGATNIHGDRINQSYVTRESFGRRRSIPSNFNIFTSSPKRFHRLWGPTGLLFYGHLKLFHRVGEGAKQPGRTFEHSTASSAEVLRPPP